MHSSAPESYSCACEDTNFKVLSAPYGETKALQGEEPYLGIIESLWEIIEPLVGITKPAEEINKPYLGDFVISSTASEAKTSIIARTPAKAVDSLYALLIFSIAII